MNWQGYSARAAVDAKKGDLAKAKADWAKAVELNPGLADAAIPSLPDAPDESSK